MSTETQQTDTSNREISMTRVFDIDRETMFDVWTDPEHIAIWWGPNGFTNTISEMEVRPGGVWRFVMHGPDGVDYPNKITYLEVVKPERLVYLHGDDEDPAHFEVRVTFEDLGEQTKLSMTSLFKTAEEREIVVEKYGAVEGLKQNMDRLDEFISKL